MWRGKQRGFNRLALSLCFVCHALTKSNPRAKPYLIIFQAVTAILDASPSKIGTPSVKILYQNDKACAVLGMRVLPRFLSERTYSATAA